jgi:cytochrome c-type biogenesis protein CcmH
MSFWIAVTALLALALIILLLPLLRSARAQTDDQRSEQNIQIAREKKAQLDAQLAAGEIDQAGFDSAYLDLQTALALELERGEAPEQKAHGNWMAIVVALMIPVSSVLLYFAFGEYRVVQNPALAQAQAPAQASQHGQSGAVAPQMSFEEMEAALKQRLQQNPDDAEGWFMLGRTLMARQEYAKAVTAFERSDELLPNEPGILFALADAKAMQNDGNLLGEPEQLVQRGLQRAPRFPNGLWLAGMAAEQRGDFREAHRYWTLLLPLVEDNPNSAGEVRSLLAMLEERDPTLATSEASQGGGGKLQLSVDISPELKARAQPGSAVFVYARAMQGPPMPLAVKRLTLAELPVTLTLGDADAMMPSMALSKFDQVVVGARVSMSGNPVAQSGDFFTERDSIDSANPPQRIDLVIDTVK